MTKAIEEALDMKRSIASILLMTLTVVCVASMMMRSARADVVVFTAQLLSSNEVPPVTNADQGAFGTATVTLDTATNTARFDVSVNNVAAPALILAHIHQAPAGVNGAVVVDSGLSPASPVPVVNGSATFTRTNLTVPPAIAQGLLANPAGFYFNVHSTLNPGGVVRGQLVRAAANTGAGAPTLSEWGMILMALLIIAACVFFLTGRGKAALALASATASTPFAGEVKPVDWKLLAKVTLFVEAAIALALVALRADAVDVLGALTSGLVVAFVLHLLIGSARRR
jgi:hypothetical protein